MKDPIPRAMRVILHNSEVHSSMCGQDDKMPPFTLTIWSNVVDPLRGNYELDYALTK